MHDDEIWIYAKMHCMMMKWHILWSLVTTLFVYDAWLCKYMTILLWFLNLMQGYVDAWKICCFLLIQQNVSKPSCQDQGVRITICMNTWMYDYANIGIMNAWKTCFFIRDTTRGVKNFVSRSGCQNLDVHRCMMKNLFDYYFSYFYSQLKVLKPRCQNQGIETLTWMDAWWDTCSFIFFSQLNVSKLLD